MWGAAGAGGAAAQVLPAVTLVAAKEGSWLLALARSWAALEGAELPAKPLASAWLFVLEASSNGNSCLLQQEQQLL